MDLIRPAPVDAGRLIFTPNPVTLEGQRNIALELRQGETLAQFLARAVPEDYGYGWEVRINGVVVPHEVMARVRPKAGVVIEVRSLLGRQALYIVAMIALTYFTFGFGAATAGMWGAGAAAGAFGGGIAGALFASAIYAGGSLLINKVLGPKPPRLSAENMDSVYSIGAARNRPRPYQPPGLLFGRVRIAPDVVSLPYSWYEGNDQYVGMILSPGLNVGRVEPMDNADTPLSSYPGTQVYYAGFSGMPEQSIPLYRNADTVQGGELQKPQGGARQWVERTTPDGTVRIQVNLEYLLSDRTSKGKPINNYQTVSVEYRKTGTTAWQALVSRKFASSTQSQKRATLSADVPAGQYDVRVSRAGDGQEAEGQNGIVQFVWSTLTCVQSSGGGAGLWPEIGVRLKATGSFSGAPDELRCIAESAPAPLWKNGAWVEEHNSNPGSHLLKLLRGIYVNGRLVAGLGLSDAEIDIEAFKAFMVHCDANGYTYDYLIREPRSIREMLASIAMVGMGEMTRNGGKHSIVWAAAGQPVSGVANMATIRRGTFQVDYALTNAADGVEYSYFDVDKWDTGIVRINAPGADSSLNPSRIAGEGVTRAAHAAELARWHMAQSAYQYKDIAFSVSVEHLSFRRLSLLSVQHDLTQWGYGGCVVSASSAAGRVTLQLDVRVPAPKSGGAWIGLRIPGERNYRVLRVQPFVGESDTITLAEPWPADAPLPGSTPENPAHDTVWAYDFRETPGARVRVVSIQPESDLGGARVVVVPEPPEYWQYIKTGQYQRPQNQSLLPRRPAVSALKISEAQTVQGDTVFTELVANFDVSESVERCIITLAQWQGSGWTDPEIVAETRSNTAKFRIPGAGRYAVSVRPYAADGTQGVAVTAEYATRGADIAPPAFDVANVEQLDGGIRRYSWAYTATPQPPDFAGAEIRYTAGTHNAPDWDSMTPLGSDGFFTAATESTVPEAGAYTFAFRPRNTSGRLGAAKIVQLTLGQNIGQQIGSVGSTVDSHTAQLVHAQQERDRIAQESLQRDIQGGLDAAADAKNKADAAKEAAYLRAQTLFGEAIAAAAADASIKADGARDVALARINTIESQVADILSADAHSASKTYPAGDLVQHAGRLYRAKQAVPMGVAVTDAVYWEYVGEYTSLGEAVSASIAQATENRTALQLERTRINGMAARMPAGTDGLATQAMVLDEMSERLSADEALAGRATVLESRAGNNEANIGVALARISAEEAARARDDEALSRRTGVVEARMPAGDGQLATAARVASVEQAASSANQATADRATQLETRAGEMQAAITGLEHAASNDRQSAAQRMDTMQADINGRATAGAVDAVTVRVNKIGGGGNLLPNSGFERNADNWRTLWNQHNIQPHVLVRDLSGPYWIPTGLHAIGQYVSTLLPQGAHIVAVAEPIPVEPGKTYCFAGHIAQHRCDSGVGIRFLNADYTELLSEPTNVVAGAINGGPKIADWRRVHVSGVAPAGAVWAQPAHWMRGREQANPFAWLCLPMFCELADGQTEPPPYAPGGNEMAGDFASEVQRINSIHAAVTDPSTGLARAHGRVDDLAQVV
ncbi:phage tail protein, partial [Lysobacteraceae bacterium NML75-0749]